MEAARPPSTPATISPSRTQTKSKIILKNTKFKASPSPSPRHNVPPVAAKGWPRGRCLRWYHNIEPQAEV